MKTTLLIIIVGLVCTILHYIVEGPSDFIMTLSFFFGVRVSLAQLNKLDVKENIRKILSKQLNSFVVN